MKRGRSRTDPMKQCRTILNYFLRHKDAEPFLEPVPWREWELLDYPTVVKHPMDLGTIKTRMDNGEYSLPDEFAYDMRLVWNNCMTYNAEDSPFHELARKYAQKFEQRFASVPRGSDPDPPSQDEKEQFSKTIYKLSSEQLGKLVHMLDERCEVCIDKTNPDEIEINVDLVDAVTFRAVSRFVRECAGVSAAVSAAEASASAAAAAGGGGGGGGSAAAGEDDEEEQRKRRRLA